MFSPAVPQNWNAPLPSRQPSCTYPNFPNPNAEGRNWNWNTTDTPDMRSPAFDAGGATEEPPPRQRPKKQASKKGVAKTQRRSSETPVAPQLMATQEVYVYPRSTPHISFPIVDYTKETRARHSSPWPVCYMAVAPNCATCRDVEEALAPRASGLVAIARTSTSGGGKPIQSFPDIMGLRNGSFQLEIWDEDDQASGSSKEARE
ncbi:hypothetical protein F5X99DRAFT_364167 [Biscogniauxia marginata]|nr:hypothetical protein F5X99DRAFT_364167 [Biscogniauxia marginata]